MIARVDDVVMHKTKEGVGTVTSVFTRDGTMYAKVAIAWPPETVEKHPEQIWALNNLAASSPPQFHCPNCEEDDWRFDDDYICGPCRDVIGFD